MCYTRFESLKLYNIMLSAMGTPGSGIMEYSILYYYVSNCKTHILPVKSKLLAND